MRACTGFWFGVEDELGCSSLPVTENGIAPRVVKVSHVLCGLKRRQNGWTLGWPGYQERPGRAARDQSEKHRKAQSLWEGLGRRTSQESAGRFCDEPRCGSELNGLFAIPVSSLSLIEAA